MSDTSVSARRWPQRLLPRDREDVLLDVLATDGGWLGVRELHRMATERHRDFKVSTGVTGSIMKRLADAGQVDRRTRGTTSTYKHRTTGTQR